MVEKRRGLILNIGSVAGTGESRQFSVLSRLFCFNAALLVPSGLLSVYSASKAFLRYWSIALSTELAPHKVQVEHATT